MAAVAFLKPPRPSAAVTLGQRCGAHIPLWRSARVAKSKKAQIDDRTVTAEELDQIDRANKSGKAPVVFVHGLWLLPSSWDRWAKLFEKAGYSALSPGWPDD